LDPNDLAEASPVAELALRGCPLFGDVRSAGGNGAAGGSFADAARNLHLPVSGGGDPSGTGDASGIGDAGGTGDAAGIGDGGGITVRAGGIRTGPMVGIAAMVGLLGALRLAEGPSSLLASVTAVTATRSRGCG
jgi:hypothetical protein